MAGRLSEHRLSEVLGIVREARAAPKVQILTDLREAVRSSSSSGVPVCQAALC